VFSLMWFEQPNR